jgi:hypothetical protein
MRVTVKSAILAIVVVAASVRGCVRVRDHFHVHGHVHLVQSTMYFIFLCTIPAAPKGGERVEKGDEGGYEPFGSASTHFYFAVYISPSHILVKKKT